MEPVFPRSRPLALATALIAGLVACDSQSSSTIRPSTNRVDSLEIQGAREIAPGGGARLSVLARMLDGSVQDATSNVVWSVSPPTRLFIDSTGFARAHEIGDADVTAAYNNRAATRGVIVVPDGTYRLAGIVTESGGPAAPLPDVRVEVTAGTGSGLATTTLSDGRYRLYGVAGPIELQVTKPGFQPRVVSISVASHVMQDVDMSPLVPRREIAGLYSLDIEADAACRDRLSEELRTRSYSAQLIQSGPLLEVRLGGATFSRSRGGAGDGFMVALSPTASPFA